MDGVEEGKEGGSAAAAAAVLCVAILPLLLLAAAVRHLVPDGIVCRYDKFVAGSLNLIRVSSFSSFKHDLVLMYHLAVLSHLRPRVAIQSRKETRVRGLDLPASSFVTGMRGAQVGVSPPRRSPPSTRYTHLVSNR